VFRTALYAVPTLLLVTSCATTIPAEDHTPPRVELRFSGPGIGSRTMTNPPLDNWEGDEMDTPYFRFAPQQTYRFSLIVQDAGGVEHARIVFPDVLTLESFEPGAAIVNPVAPHTELVVFGDRSRPVNTLVLSGTLRAPRTIETNPPVSADGLYISAMGYDFGGRSGARNGTVLILRAGLADR